MLEILWTFGSSMQLAALDFHFGGDLDEVLWLFHGMHA